MPHALHIETFALGDWQTNCYVLHRAATDTAGLPCWIVDCGYQPGRLIEYIVKRGLAPQAVVLTHAHLDHIAGLHEVRAQWPQIPILIHQAEEKFLTDPSLNLSIVMPQPLIMPKAAGFLVPGQPLSLDGFDFEIRHTPGHSPGGVSLYQKQEKVVLAGDVLFAGSIGRYDFPTSDAKALFRSIATQLLTLPDDTLVLPGHGESTTIGEERASNPYLQSRKS